MEQDYPLYEVIVIDQSEKLSDRKREFIVHNAGKVKYFQTSQKGRSSAKNQGILQAIGDVVLFCDDDILPPSNLLSTHAKNHANKSLVGGVCCRLIEKGQPEAFVTVPLRTTFYGRLVNKAFSTSSGYVTSLNGGNMSIRRSVINQCGFFEEAFDGTSMVEEPDYAFRILKNGHRIFFDASCTVMHYPQKDGNIASIESNRARWFRSYFHNLAIYFIKYGRFWNLPFVFLYCLSLSGKHIVQHSMRITDYFAMVGGFFSGIRKGFQLYSHDRTKPFFTDCRSHKQLLQPL
jgi:GT2 family glycosyltransferase